LIKAKKAAFRENRAQLASLAAEVTTIGCGCREIEVLRFDGAVHAQ
jgi:hypothetical protein